MRNILKLRKNLCLARKFNVLKKEELLARGRSAFYIDVWPVSKKFFKYFFNFYSIKTCHTYFKDKFPCS